VVLGVSGGIAAYKAVILCRLMVDAGAHVAPVMTAAAQRFVGRATFDALASERVQTSIFGEDDPIPHTTLGQTADVVVVAPATARVIGSYAAGISDGLLTATLLATRAPVVVCPAMHTEMWEHAAVQHNIEGLVPGLGVVRGELVPGEPRRAVDQGVDRSQTAGDGLREPGGLGGHGQVRPEGAGVDAAVAQLGDRLAGPVPGPVVRDCDVRARFGQCQRDGPTDAVSAAGHQRDPSREFHPLQHCRALRARLHRAATAPRPSTTWSQHCRALRARFHRAPGPRRAGAGLGASPGGSVRPQCRRGVDRGTVNRAIRRWELMGCPGRWPTPHHRHAGETVIRMTDALTCSDPWTVGIINSPTQHYCRRHGSAGLHGDARRTGRGRRARRGGGRGSRLQPGVDPRRGPSGP